MNKSLSFLVLFLIGISMIANANNNLTLWYNSPAYNWNKALPIGNGRIAAMVYGNPENEEFQLNEETISKGSPYNNYNPTTKNHLANLRQLIFAGRSQEAQELATDQIIGPRPMGFGAPYQPAGSLFVRFADHKGYCDMKRELKLDSAISVVTYKVGNIKILRRGFHVVYRPIAHHPLHSIEEREAKLRCLYLASRYGKRKRKG